MLLKKGRRPLGMTLDDFPGNGVMPLGLFQHLLPCFLTAAANLVAKGPQLLGFLRAIQENMGFPAGFRVFGGNLHPGNHLNAQALAQGQKLRPSGEGIVVCDGDCRQISGSGQVHQLFRGHGAIRAEGMTVKVSIRSCRGNHPFYTNHAAGNSRGMNVHSC